MSNQLIDKPRASIMIRSLRQNLHTRQRAQQCLLELRRTGAVALEIELINLNSID